MLKSNILEFMEKIKIRLKKCWRWLRTNVFTKDMILWILLAEFIFWLPVIVCGVLAIVVSPWWWSAVTTIIVFWSAPFTPATALQFALAGVFKALYNKRKKRGGDN